MSFDFNASHNNFLRIAPAVIGNGGTSDCRPVSFGFRLRRDGTGQMWVFEMAGSDDPGFGVLVGAGASSTVLRVYSGYPSATYTDSSAFANDITSWHSYLVTYNTGAPGALAFYRDGAAVSATTKTYGQVSGSRDETVIGTLIDRATGTPLSTFNIDGALAETAIWNVVLDADESIAYTKGASPLQIRPSALRSYVPLNGVSNKDWLRGNWTVNGTITKQADHPPVLLPCGPILYSPTPAAAGPAATSFYPYPPVHPGVMNMLMR